MSQQPEPCKGTHGAQCYAPLACSSFGYCRMRNFIGLPSEETAARWREEAAALKREKRTP